MEKHRVDKTRYTSYLPDIVLDQLRELSDTASLSQTYLLEEAVIDVINKYYGKLNNP